MVKDRDNKVLESLHKWQRLHQYCVNSSDMLSTSPGIKESALSSVDLSLYNDSPSVQLQA